MKSSAAKTGRAKPHRGMIGIASHAVTPEGLRNSWERSGQGEFQSLRNLNNLYFIEQTYKTNNNENT